MLKVDGVKGVRVMAVLGTSCHGNAHVSIIGQVANPDTTPILVIYGSFLLL